MSSTGVREPNDPNKRIIKGLINNESQFIQSLRVFANTSTLSGLGSTEGEINNSPQDPSGNYLSRLGDKMSGPFALNPPLDFTIEIDANNTINIGPLDDNAQYTSNIQLDSIQPNGFVLNIIAGAAFDGQLLFLRTFAPSPVTISQGTLANGGNIQTGDGEDLIVGDLQIISFIFDEALIIGENSGGSWRVFSVSSGGGGGIEFPIDFPERPASNVNTTQNITFSNSDRHSRHYTLNKNSTFAFLSPPVDKTAFSSITLVQDNTGGRTVTLPAGTVNKEIVENGILQGPNEETGIVIKWSFGTFYAFLETGNRVSAGGGGTSNLSGLTIDINKDWLAQGISNVGALTGVTSIDLDDAGLIEGIKELRFFDDDPDKNIKSAAAELSYNVPALEKHSFYTGGVEVAKFIEAAATVYKLDMLNHQVKDVKELLFSNGSGAPVLVGNFAGIGFNSDDQDFHFNAPDAAKFLWTTNFSTELMGLTASQLTFAQGLRIQANPNATTPGLGVGQISSDPTGAANGDLWYNSTTNKFRGRENSSNVDILTSNINTIGQLNSNITVTDSGLGLIKNTVDAIDVLSIQFNRIDVGSAIGIFGLSTLNFDDGSAFSMIVEQAASVFRIGLFDAAVGTNLNEFKLEFDGDIAFGVDGDKTQIFSTKPLTQTAQLNFFRDDPNPIPNDPIGEIQFFGKNNATVPETIEYGKIEVDIFDETDGSEDSIMRFWHKSNGFDINILTLADGRLTLTSHTDGLNNEIAEMRIVREDGSPSPGVTIGDLDFAIFDDGVFTTYATIRTLVPEAPERGLFKIRVRANNTAVQDAFAIEGDDNNDQFQILTAFNGSARMQPQSSGNMAYFVTPQVVDFSLSIGTSGTLECPRINDGNPGANDLNSAGGAFVTSLFVHDIADGALYIKTSNTSWDKYDRTTTVS